MWDINLNIADTDSKAKDVRGKGVGSGGRQMCGDRDD